MGVNSLGLWGLGPLPPFWGNTEFYNGNRLTYWVFMEGQKVYCTHGSATGMAGGHLKHNLI